MYNQTRSIKKTIEINPPLLNYQIHSNKNKIVAEYFLKAF